MPRLPGRRARSRSSCRGWPIWARRSARALQGRLALTGKLDADGAASALTLDLDGQGIGTDRPMAQRLTAQIRLPALDLQ